MSSVTVRIDVDYSQLDAAIEKAKELLAVLREAGVVDGVEPTTARPPAPYRIGDFIEEYVAARPFHLCGQMHDGWTCTVKRDEAHSWHVAVGSDNEGAAIVRDVWPA